MGELPPNLVGANGNAAIAPLNPAHLVVGPNYINGHQVTLAEADVALLQAPSLSANWSSAAARYLARYYCLDAPAAAFRERFVHVIFIGN